MEILCIGIFAFILTSTSSGGKRFELKRGPAELSGFIHKPYLFPIFLAYENITLLDCDEKLLWKGSELEKRDLNQYMKPTKHGAKHSLSISGLSVSLPKGRNHLILLRDTHKQTFVTFDQDAIFPYCRYIMNSGEIVCRHGKFYINIGLQKRNLYDGIYALLIFLVPKSLPPVPPPRSNTPPPPQDTEMQDDPPPPRSNTPPPPQDTEMQDPTPPSRSNTPPPPQDTEMQDDPPPIPSDQSDPMDIDDPPPFDPLYEDVWFREWWRYKKDAATERLMKHAGYYGLRMLRSTDRIPPSLVPRLKELGHLVLIREGPPMCDKKKHDPLRFCLQYSLGTDPNMKCFLVNACDWTGDEFWIGFDQSSRIGAFQAKISAIQSEISVGVKEDERVVQQEDICRQKSDVLISAKDAVAVDKAFKASEKANSDLLKLKAKLTIENTVPRQKEIDDLWLKIDHIQKKLHTISCEFLSHWDLIAIPRFGLHNMIKRGGGKELGNKQKAILSAFAHGKCLDRLKTAARKRGCDIVEVTECGSTKNCSHCNSKNSPLFGRFYHCLNCKRKMTRDGNAALNIFKMALSVILMRLRNKSNFPDLLYDPEEDDDGDDGDVESESELNWDEERVLEQDEEDTWREKEEGKEGKRKRGENDTCERGPLRESNVLPGKRRAVRDQSGGCNSGLFKDIDPSALVLNL
jgi:hypothetical protein